MNESLSGAMSIFSEFICLTVHDHLALSFVSEQFSKMCPDVPLLHRYNCLQQSDRPDCFARQVEGVSLEELHVLLDTNVKKLHKS